jgi:hypothetical protein
MKAVDRAALTGAVRPQYWRADSVGSSDMAYRVCCCSSVDVGLSTGGEVKLPVRRLEYPRAGADVGIPNCA